MKYNIILMSLFLNYCTVTAAERYNCYEYPSASYMLIHTTNTMKQDSKTEQFIDKDLTKKVDTDKYRLLLVASKKETRGHERHLFLLDSHGGEIAYTYHSCPSRKLHPDILYCYGEDDSGIFSIEPNKSINFKTQGVTLGEVENFWDIKPKDDANLPKPAKVTCPQSVESTDMIPDSNSKEYKVGIRTAYEHLEEPARYVCYTSKKMIGDTMYYRGCRYTRDSCDNYYGDMKHFGKYATQKEALRAFERCKNATPKVSKNLSKSNMLHGFSIKEVYENRMPVFEPPLSTFGLSGKNKQVNYRQARRIQLPKAYAKANADIMNKTQKGWLVLNRREDRVIHLNEKKQLFWNIRLRDIVREKQYIVDDIRYESPILYFNAACPSYAKEQKNKCSTLYAYDTKNKRLLWHSRYLTSRNIFILTDKLVITGYGFTAEPDYLYILRKTDGKVLKKIKLDTAPEYLEMRENQLHVITYNNHYVFKLNIL